MKKLFAKENEKFVKGVIVKTKTESNVTYLVDDDDKKLNPDYLWDLWVKGLLRIQTATGSGMNPTIISCPASVYKLPNYVSVDYIDTIGGSAEVVTAFSDGYTAG